MKKRLPTVMLLLGGLLTLYLIHNAWSADETPFTRGDSGSVGANLTLARLYGADLASANVTDAFLEGVLWNDTTCPDGTNNHNGTCS